MEAKKSEKSPPLSVVERPQKNLGNTDYEKIIHYLQQMIRSYDQRNIVLSREINEDINQNITAIKMRIEHIIKRIKQNSDNELIASLYGMDLELSKIIIQLRNFSYQLDLREYNQHINDNFLKGNIEKMLPEMREKDIVEILNLIDMLDQSRTDS
jgi:signal transduction histidine kinase